MSYFSIKDFTTGVAAKVRSVLVNTDENLAAHLLQDSAGNEILGTKTDAKSAATDTTSVSIVSILKQLSAYLALFVYGAGTAAAAQRTTLASDDPAVTVLGAKADAKSTATDTTSISIMSVLKQVSASVQLMVIGAGTNLIGKFGIDQTTSGTTNAVVPTAAAPAGGISTTARLASSAASTNATNVKGSAGRIYGVQGENTAAYDVFLVLYDSATNPPVPGTTTIRKKIAVPSGAAFSLMDGALGHSFANGIGYAFTKLVADADTTAIAAGDIIAFNLDYA